MFVIKTCIFYILNNYVIMFKVLNIDVLSLVLRVIFSFCKYL